MDSVKPLIDWFFTRDPAAFFAGLFLGLLFGYLLCSMHAKFLIAMLRQTIEELRTQLQRSNKRIKVLKQKIIDLDQMLRDTEKERDACLKKLGHPETVVGDSQNVLATDKAEAVSFSTQSPGTDQIAAGDNRLRERLIQAYQQKAVPKDVAQSFVDTITRGPFNKDRFRAWNRHGQYTPAYIRRKGPSVNHRVEIPGGKLVLAPIKQLEELDLN
jgi:hypothetical protein